MSMSTAEGFERFVSELDDATAINVANAGFGQDKRTGRTARAALLAMDPNAVAEAVAFVRQAQADAAARKAAGAAEAREANVRPEVTFTCESDLRFVYNRPYALAAGETHTLPRPVAMHAGKVARAAGAQFRIGM